MEGRKTGAEGHDIQEPQRKNTHQRDLLSRRDLEPPGRHHGQGQRDDVPQHVVHGIAVPDGDAADAVARDTAVPVAGDGQAVEDGDDDGGEGVGEDVGDDAPGGDAEAAGGEDLEVEEDDGGFGQVDGEFVEDLRDPEGLVDLAGGDL